jgi:hypothetical protein
MRNALLYIASVKLNYHNIKGLIAMYRWHVHAGSLFWARPFRQRIVLRFGTKPVGQSTAASHQFPPNSHNCLNQESCCQQSASAKVRSGSAIPNPNKPLVAPCSTRGLACFGVVGSDHRFRGWMKEAKPRIECGATELAARVFAFLLGASMA